eukprot:g1342.t1
MISTNSSDGKKEKKKVTKRRALHEPKQKVSATFRRPKVYWVPKDKNGPGRWVRPKIAKMNPKTLERLTRQKKPAAKRSSGSSATGRYLLPGGGRFSLAKPKGEFDWVVARAKETPGPNQYNVKVNEWGTGGIKISDANPKSEIEWVIYRSKHIPAPNEYGLIKMPGPSGGQFSTAFPLSDLDLTILRANDIPGPNEYDIDLCPTGVSKQSKSWIKQALAERKSVKK